MKRTRASELLAKFSEQRLLVVGDVILDKFVWGEVNRFSPEAHTCPILDHTGQTTMLGGAGNVATNLNALGSCCVSLVGTIGGDPEADELRLLMQEEKLDDGLLQILDRSTTVKTRFVSKGAHLLRYDREVIEPVGQQEEKVLLSTILGVLTATRGGCHGIIIQDYAKGVVTPSLLRALMGMAKEENVPVFIDPKKEHWYHFRDAELVKPNLREAMAAFGVSGDDQANHVAQWGRSMLQYTRAKAVIVTQGKDGMYLFTDEQEARVLPQPTEVVDVSGAGDTSMATLALSKLAGASWIEAMVLANVAAGIAVGKHGTSVVTTDELLDRFSKEENDE